MRFLRPMGKLLQNFTYLGSNIPAMAITATQTFFRWRDHTNLG